MPLLAPVTRTALEMPCSAGGVSANAGVAIDVPSAMSAKAINAPQT
jgi:hypothetical protein